MGRPPIPFDEKSDRSKRREAAALSSANEHNPRKILLAASHAANKSGENDMSACLKAVLNSPESPKKIRKILETKINIRKKSAEEGLAFLLHNNLSKQLYINMRLECKISGADIWPSYMVVSNAKQNLRPPKEVITISENVAEIPVQKLLNLTIKRIIELQKNVLLQYAQSANCMDKIEMVLISSWGFDGSTGHSAYKQYMPNCDIHSVIDENMFAISLIPLRLSTAGGHIIWNNNLSQSSMSCRPIKLQFAREMKELIQNKKKYIDNQISHLKDFEINLEGYHFKIKFLLLMTLIDGKVLSVVTNTKSSQSCPICKANPKDFNNLSNIKSGKFQALENSLQYGISPVHAWIRIFECCLHISYRLDVKTWHIRGAENKEKCAKRKKQIQEILWEKLGLRVDKSKPGGSGTTNDGNTARKAFTNTKILSECLELDFKLLTNFKFILISLSCHLPLNAKLFEKLCHSTAELFVSLYPWFYMPSTVHKILIHGGQIIRSSILPLGMLGEEGSEARNKDYKNFRLHHSRKHSRQVTMEDMFYRLMDTSDPIILNLNVQSRLRMKNRIPIPKEVLDLLDIPKNIENDLILSNNEEEDSDIDEETDLDCSLKNTELTDDDEQDTN